MRQAIILPGLALAIALGALGAWLSDLIGIRLLGFDRSPISPVMISIVLGMIIGNSVTLPDWTRPGLRFALTRVLRLGIILLGIRLSIVEVARLGVLSIPVVLVAILFGIAFTRYLNRRLSLPPRLGTLIGVGTSICGVSAIVATGPGIDAQDEEVTYAITVITVFGLVAMLVYPYLAHLLFSGDPTAVGLFLGTSVHDTSQVNGAGMIYADAYAAPRALDVAIVTKLVRNVFMVVVIPAMAFAYHRSVSQADGGSGTRVPVGKLFPMFVVGFVLVALFRSVGDLGIERGGNAFGLWSADAWVHLCGTVKRWSTIFMVIALSAVGLSTDFRAMKALSLRPFFVGLGAALAVGVVTTLTIWLLGAVGVYSSLVD